MLLALAMTSLFASPGACDLSTDAAVLARWASVTRKALGERACLLRPASFPGLVLVGGFASDRGCAHTGLLFACELDESAPGQAAAAALEAAGWGDPAQREREAWLARSGGMLPQTDFSRVRVTFGPDGVVRGRETLEQVTAPSRAQ